jgi:small lipoprotein (TIGR04452 family)
MMIVAGAMNQCILLDQAHTPIISDPDGSRVKESLNGALNLLDVQYLTFFTLYNPLKGSEMATKESLITKLLVLNTLPIQSNKYYRDETVTDCMTKMAINEIIFFDTIVNQKSAVSVISGIEDNLTLAKLIPLGCDIKEAPKVINFGTSGI